MQAKDLIAEARSYDRAFHRRFSQDKPLVTRLSRLEQAVSADLAGEYPEALAVDATIAEAAITTALAGTGILPVPAYITILKPMYGDLKDSAGGGFLTVAQIPRSQQYRGGAPFPSVALSDKALHLTDLRKIRGTKHGWEDVEQLRYDYVPLPAALASPTDELTVPDGLGGYLAASLAHWMARRLRLWDVVREIGDDKGELMGSFLSTVALQNRGGTWHVLDEGRA